MTLQPGRMLAHYRLVEKIGEGGMGVVWKAEDTKLSRAVAVKILPAEFSEDRQRLARFRREAKLLAALNHPNVAAIYGFEHVEGIHFLVLELVAGQSLSRTTKMSPPSVEDALDVCRQVAEGLAAAHEAGVIHRDLKPGNVMVTADGKAKVLDFGLAKGLERAPSGESGSHLSMSPTLSVGGTQAGVVLGTAPYMSPEQARGKKLDRRTDIFSFGCLLYECLTGKPAFTGETLTDTLLAVIQKDPDWKALPYGAPRRIRDLLERCLRKKPQDRLRDMGDVALLLRDAVGTASAEDRVASEHPVRAGWPRMIPALTAALLLGGAAAWFLKPSPEPAPAPDARFEIMLGQDRSFSANYNRVVTISPDGRNIAYISGSLWLRAMEDVRPHQVPDTHGPRSPAFSPDSRQVAFWEGGFVKRALLDGSPPIVVGELHERPFGMQWADDGFTYVGRADRGIWKVPGSGGEPELVLKLNEGEHAHGPELLPGGEWILFTLARGVRDWTDASIVAQSLKTGERRVLVPRGREARYARSGHLTYVQDSTLFAVPFDLDRLEVTGEAVAMETGVHTSTAEETGAASYDFSDNGVLAFASATGLGSKMAKLAFLDPAGELALLPMDARRFAAADISPDGERIAVQIDDLEGTHIWILGVDRGGAQRLTTTGRNTSPVWSHDGRHVFFASDRDGDTDIWRRPADLSGPAEQVLDADGAQLPESASTDGRWLLFSRMAPGNSDLGRVSLTGEPAVEMLVESPADELNARFSPDGRFFCFQSNETGRWDIHVVEIATRRRWIVSSTSNGFLPFWTRDGRRIIFMSGLQKVLSVDVTTEPEFTAGEPVLAFHFVPGKYNVLFDVTRPGDRALVGDISTAVDDQAETRPRVTVVLNWFDQLKKRAGGDSAE